MNLKLDRGEAAFWAEYQNEPLPEEQVDDDLLTADQIAAKVNGMKRGEVPLGATALTMFIDVQGKALYWLVAAWEDDFTGYVIDYGTEPEQREQYFTLRDIRRTLASTASRAGLEGAIYTDAAADAEASQVEPMDTVDMDRGTWLTMPFGWKIGQLKAEQPTTVYGDFKHGVINEIARCLNMPFNIAAGNSSGYNYASGRLDHQAFFKAIRIDQAYLADVVLDRILKAWLNEAVLIEGYLPQSVPLFLILIDNPPVTPRPVLGKAHMRDCVSTSVKLPLCLLHDHIRG